MRTPKQEAVYTSRSSAVALPLLLTVHAYSSTLTSRYLPQSPVFSRPCKNVWPHVCECL